MMKYRVSKKDIYEFKEKHVTVYRTEQLQPIAEAAFIFLEKWGMVQASDAGEDSAGRAKTSLMSSVETVRRAFDIAEEAYRVARERGLLLQLPDLNEINAEVDAKEKATA